MESPLVHTWRRNNDANLFLLDFIPESALSHRYSERTRTVAAQFTHMHNVRVYHLEGRAPETPRQGEGAREAGPADQIEARLRPDDLREGGTTSGSGRRRAASEASWSRAVLSAWWSYEDGEEDWDAGLALAEVVARLS
jgi:hypothetical protein